MDMLKQVLLWVPIQKHRKPPHLVVKEVDLERKKLQQDMQQQSRMRQLLGSLSRAHIPGRLRLGQI